LDVLRGLSGFDRLLREVAKWHIRQASQNPSGSVPKGFDERFRLTLSGLEQGSAVPVISIEETESALPGMPLPYHDAFEQASHTVVQTILMVSQDPEPALLLPREFLKYFGPIGKPLLLGEQIILDHQAVNCPASYSADVHRRVMDLAQAVEISRPVTLRGRVPEADQMRMKFEFHPRGTKRLISPMPVDHYSTILQAFAGYRHHVSLEVHGTGRYNAKGTLIGLSHIEGMELRYPMDPAVQLEELIVDRAGNRRVTASAPLRSGIEWLTARFSQHYSSDMTSPTFSSASEDVIAIEWVNGSSEVLLHVSLTDHSGEWNAVDVASGESRHSTLDLDDEEHWRWIADQIQQFSVEAANDSGGFVAQTVSADDLPELIAAARSQVEEYEQRHGMTSERMAELVDGDEISPSIEVINWYHTYDELRFLLERTPTAVTHWKTTSTSTSAG
jgi:hypothetical protein